jgi:hypothetical protein
VRYAQNQVIRFLVADIAPARYTMLGCILGKDPMPAIIHTCIFDLSLIRH